MSSSSGATGQESLIATKLNPSEFDPRLISRRTLLDAFLGGGRRRSVLSIVASAGSGKSTLMAELHRTFADRGAKTCWLSLDSDDNSPAAFAVYFISALRSIDPTFVEIELAQLRCNPVHDFTALTNRLIRKISTVTSDTAIFLDDFQHITDNNVLSFINKLAAHIPPAVRLVIASRSHLPLDLGRLRVSGQLIEVEQEALNFTSSQAADFLQRVHGVELNQSDLGALVETTEGWPTGLQLAALALRRHHGPARELIDTFSGRDKDLISYLVESVLRSQPESVRTFLLRTAPLRRMSPALCQAVSGHPNCGEMLAHIERSNLFLIPLDRHGQWYRYHHLFAEFLLNELQRSAPGKFQSVCDKATQWCESNGHTTEAIQYALDGQRYEKASDLIAKHAPAVSQWQGDHYTILDWMRRLPERFHGHRPEILLSHAWSLAFSRGAEQAMELTDRVLAQLRSDLPDGWAIAEEEKIRLRLLARVTQAIAEASLDRLESSVARCVDLRTQIPESEPFLISSTCNCLSYCHFAKRDFESSANAASDGYLYGHRSGTRYPTGWADFLHGLADVELGRLRTAQEHSRRVEDSARNGGAAHSYLAALAALLNAEIATHRCEFDKTRTYMEVGKSFMAAFGPLEPLLLAIRNQARQLTWAGDFEAARCVLMQGQDLALTLNQPRLFLTLAIEETTLRLNIGDVAGALETAQRARLQDDKSVTRGLDGFRGVRDALQVLQARMLIEDGKAAAALRVLNLQQHAMTSNKCGSIGLTVKAMKAIALWQCERPAEAIRELDRALSSAAAEFHAYPIVSAGPALLPVLRAICERRAETSSLGDLEAKHRLQHWLVSLLSGESPDRGSVRPSALETREPSESLTEREVELLGLVEAGLANKQLADELLISEATVKWHLHNIYSKIGVRNRMAATARARELRLI
jgi:ATP/maltotriose-dependent transcriptional regulator MalT